MFNQRGGVYFLYSVTFSETNSTYTNNTALFGGSISCSKCSMTTYLNKYSYNMAN